MDALEKKLEALIAEVKAMRASRNAPSAYSATAQFGQPKAAGGGGSGPLPTFTGTRINRTLGESRRAESVAGEGASNVQMLSRATYKLPKDKAEALAAFLREHMKSPVEVKVDVDSLIVTASPEEQAILGQFIALSEGKQHSVSAKLLQYSQPAQSTFQYAHPAQSILQAAPPYQAAPATTSEPPKAAAPVGNSPIKR